MNQMNTVSPEDCGPGTAGSPGGAGLCGVRVFLPLLRL